MMISLLQAVAILAWFFGCFLLVGSHFLAETRLLLGGIYLLIGTNAGAAAVQLWQLRKGDL